LSAGRLAASAVVPPSCGQIAIYLLTLPRNLPGSLPDPRPGLVMTRVPVYS
jgi:hypothetical protein